MLASLTPEIFLLVGLIAALIFSLTREGDKVWLIAKPLSGMAFLSSMMLAVQADPQGQQYFGGSFILDPLSTVLKSAILLALTVIIIMNGAYPGKAKAEQAFLLLAAGLGACLLVSSHDFLLMFVALETLSLSTIALVAQRREDPLSGEAGLKYLINAAVASSILLFGISLIYGLTLGHTNFEALGRTVMAFTQLQKPPMLFYPMLLMMVPLLLMVFAVGFKLALPPFHMWAPDVYQGGNTVVTSLLATVSKLAGFGIFVRLGQDVFGVAIGTFLPGLTWVSMFAMMAIAAMIVGNLVGIRQVLRTDGSMRRLLAYSSIAQMGYVTVTSALGLPEATAYLMLYVLVTLAAFCFLLQIEEWFVRHGLEASEADRILSLRGLAKVKPGLALGLSLALSGLAGILPSMLVAKLLLVNASFGQGLTNLFQASNQGTALLALLGTVGGGVLVASSVLAVFYYFYPIKRMFVDEPEEKLLRAGHDTSVPRIGLGARANLISATTILILGFAVGLMPQLWLTVVQNL